MFKWLWLKWCQFWMPEFYDPSYNRPDKEPPHEPHNPCDDTEPHWTYADEYHRKMKERQDKDSNGSRSP